MRTLRWLLAGLGIVVVLGPATLSRDGPAPAAETRGGARPAAASASHSGQLPLVSASPALRSLVQTDPARVEEVLRALRERMERPQRSPAQAGSHGSTPRRDRSSSRALALLEAASLLRRGEPRAGVGGETHTRYRLFKQGKPVLNRAGILHERLGRLVGRAGALTFPPLSPEGATLHKDGAIERALEAAGVEAIRGTPLVEEGWFALARATVPAWRVVIPASRPFGTWQIVLDARTAATLSLVDLVRTATGVGSVYDPNRALSPTPTDVSLYELDDSGQLAGHVVRVFDVNALSAFRPDLEFRFPEGDPRFVQTSVYRGVTDTGLFAEDRGFPSFSEPLFAYTNLADPSTGGEYNNAFYDPYFRLLGFGNGDGVVTANLGTDLDVAAHETAHHFFEVLVEPLILSAMDPVLAMAEGVADTFSALVGGDPDVGESTIPGQPYLRTLANSETFPDGIADDPHVTGLVFGGANWDLIQLLGADVFTSLLFDALPRIPPDALWPEYRDAFLDANLALRGGANQSQIQAIFTARGFDELDMPPEFEGILEDGIPQSRYLPDSPYVPDPLDWNFHFFGFAEFPGSTSLRVETSGGGNVDLVVISLDDPDAEAAVSEGWGSNEQITLTRFTSPSVDAGDSWGIFLIDYPDASGSSYTVSAEATLPPAQIVIDGAPYRGYIDVAGGFDVITFDTASSNRVVRVEVEALDATLDPLVGVIHPKTFEVFGVDDDSGPGTDALVQGALLPSAETYALVVLSLTADVDPTIGTGDYELRLRSCDNKSGPNTDGDALVDACDDDDDDDGVFDSADTGPLDPALCSDMDLDGCDDCISGTFDVFDDGPDNDADGLCDAGDADDDNDGCTDDVDAAPFAASADDDFDFLGSDCDNCPREPNPQQEDADGDEIGDVCECGDINADGFVNTIDARLIQRCSVGEDLPGICSNPLCDTTDDGSCNTIDARLVQRFAVGELIKSDLHCSAR